MRIIYPAEERQIALATGTMQIRTEAGHFPLDDLIGFAARANPKRGFLFLSKVLGKHWPVRPSVMQTIHADLAAQIPTDLAYPMVFIAMAETAVGLGQGVFEAYKKQHPDSRALFLHTSRYAIPDSQIIEFEEAHSHAPRQFLHLPVDPACRDLLYHARSLVLIDDEASTGNTFLNLTHACRALSPALERVHLATITNFMGQAANAALTMRFGLPVSLGAVLNGEYAFVPAALLPLPNVAQRFAAQAERGASAAFGRLGLSQALCIPHAYAAQLAANIAPNERVLLVGTGEFMHGAFLLGQALEALGLQVFVQSSTRSPILLGGAVQHILSFPDNYGEGVENFIYNVSAGQYEHVFVCHETPANPALFALAQAVQGRLLQFLSENMIEEISIC